MNGDEHTQNRDNEETRIRTRCSYDRDVAMGAALNQM